MSKQAYSLVSLNLKMRNNGWYKEHRDGVRCASQINL